MSNADTPRETKLLPDAIHHAVKPGTALLRLETTHARQGVLDGAWWPRSRDIGAELPSLITALTGHLGPVDRVGLDSGAWEELPTRLIIDDRVVHIDSFPVGDDTVVEATRTPTDPNTASSVPRMKPTQPAATRSTTR
ncbi:DUF5994 family protein [Streptomyces sp. NPDC059881]|uniref:DUF5994 family protein n=1 Tax=Streptomyces sp. NPDC059881 TaxID=3346986 RepID=UPI003659F557